MPALTVNAICISRSANECLVCDCIVELQLPFRQGKHHFPNWICDLKLLIIRLIDFVVHFRGFIILAFMTVIFNHFDYDYFSTHDANFPQQPP